MHQIIWLKTLAEIEALNEYTIDWGFTITCEHRLLPHSGRLIMHNADLFKDALGTLVRVLPDNRFVKIVSFDNVVLCQFSTHYLRLFGVIFRDEHRPTKLWARLRTKQDIELYIGKYIPPICAQRLCLGGIVTIDFDSYCWCIYSEEGTLIEEFLPFRISQYYEQYNEFVRIFVKDIYDMPFSDCKLAVPITHLFTGRL